MWVNIPNLKSVFVLKMDADALLNFKEKFTALLSNIDDLVVPIP